MLELGRNKGDETAAARETETLGGSFWGEVLAAAFSLGGGLAIAFFSASLSQTSIIQLNSVYTKALQ